jgi:hypothetical protein
MSNLLPLAIWHSPTKDVNGKGKGQGLAAKLQRTQNKCLRVVAGAYRATPTRTLEIETHVPPIDLYFDSRLAAFQDRLAGSEVGQLIQNTCLAIRARIRNRRGRRAKPKALAGEQKNEWVRERAGRIQQNHPTRRITTEKQRVLAAWKTRWQVQETQKQGTQDYWDQSRGPQTRLFSSCIRICKKQRVLCLHSSEPAAQDLATSCTRPGSQDTNQTNVVVALGQRPLGTCYYTARTKQSVEQP